MTPDPIKQEQQWEFNVWWHLIFPLGVVFLIGCAVLLWKYHQADKPESFTNTRPSNLRVKQ